VIMELDIAIFCRMASRVLWFHMRKVRVYADHYHFFIPEKLCD